MNWGETKKTRGRGREKEASRHLPQPFSCLTSVQLFAQLHYSCIFLKNTSENHAKKKPAGDLPTFCPPCQGLTKTSKVWVQTNIFLTRKWLDLVIRNTFSSVNALVVMYYRWFKVNLTTEYASPFNRRRGQVWSSILILNMLSFVGVWLELQYYFSHFQQFHFCWA